jgi:predicted acyl esterase
VAIFDPGTRQWRYENEYPLKRTQWTPWFLHGGGAFSPDRPGEEVPDRYRMPDSYAQLTAGKPALSYATPPLERDLRVWGPASLTLHAASSAIDTVWFVKVIDVPPSGPPQLATRGILKASFRALDASRSRPGQPYHPFQKQDLLEPNRAYEFQIELSPLCRTFKKGHRIELQIASEDLHYTNFLRQIDVQLLPWPVENTIHHDRAHPSHLLLPVIPDAAEIRPVEPPLAQVDWPLVPGSWLPHTDEFPLRD